MLRVMGLVAVIALADSANPATIAPGLYLASGQRARSRVLEFALAVFVVQLAAGLLIALGPGDLLLHALPKLSQSVRYTVEIAVGAALIVMASVLWIRRKRVARKDLPEPKRKSTLTLGATIVVVELPTAFPYFAAIVAAIGSGMNAAGQALVLAIFNLCFVIPLVMILGLLLVAPGHAQGILRQAREGLQRRWPVAFAVLMGVAGILAIVLGVSGFVSTGHGSVARSISRVRRSVHP